MLVTMIKHRSGGAGRLGVWGPVVWAFAMAATLIGCTLTGPTMTSLSEEWAAKLRTSGSVELISGGHDAEQTPEGPLAAIAWREYGVDASWDEVVAYFDAELRDRGWEEGGGSSGLRSTIEYAVEAWHKGDRILRLGHLRNSPKPDSGSFVTFYSVTLIGQGVPSE